MYMPNLPSMAEITGQAKAKYERGSSREVKKHIKEITRIPDDWVGAAMCMATIAYPKEWEKRSHFVEAVKAWYGKNYLMHGGARKNVPAPLRAMPNRKIMNIINRGFDRLKKRRLPAALMAVWLLGRGMKNITFKPDTIESISKNIGKLLQDCYSVGNDTTTRSVRQRVWAETKPVLHLAMMLNAEIQRRRDIGTFIDPLDLIVDSSWLSESVNSAETWRNVIRKPLHIRKAIVLII